LSAFWGNPAGIIVVSVCAVALLVSCAAACRNYGRYAKLDPQLINDSAFAAERRSVLAADKTTETSLPTDVVHRLRHDFLCGGIMWMIPGHPFDWSQRLLVFVTTLIVSLLVSMMLFAPGKPDCTEVCNQDTATSDVQCSLVCVEVKQSGLSVTLVSSAVTLPVIMGLTQLFKCDPSLLCSEPLPRVRLHCAMPTSHLG